MPAESSPRGLPSAHPSRRSATRRGPPSAGRYTAFSRHPPARCVRAPPQTSDEPVGPPGDEPRRRRDGSSTPRAHSGPPGTYNHGARTSEPRSGEIRRARQGAGVGHGQRIQVGVMVDDREPPRGRGTSRSRGADAARRPTYAERKAPVVTATRPATDLPSVEVAAVRRRARRVFPAHTTPAPPRRPNRRACSCRRALRAPGAPSPKSQSRERGRRPDWSRRTRRWPEGARLATGVSPARPADPADGAFPRLPRTEVDRSGPVRGEVSRRPRTSPSRSR